MTHVLYRNRGSHGKGGKHVETLSQASVLPIQNELGFYEMRFESIGGLGANLAAQMLAESIIMGQNLNGANFASYGSEKKGSEVKAYIRLCDLTRNVRTSSPVERPHLLAVFHPSMGKDPSVLSGLYPNSVVVINTNKSADDYLADTNIAQGQLAVLNAQKIAIEEKTRINTAMLGAIAKASGFIDPEHLRQTIRDTFQHKYPTLVEPNIRTFDRGYDEVQIVDIKPATTKAPIEWHRPIPEIGYLNAPIGGIIVNPGNSVLKDLSISRQGFVPTFLREKCTDCGLCDMTCPDYCFDWEKGTDKRGKEAMVLKGFNTNHCKGCLKCVEICPTGALIKTREVI